MLISGAAIVRAFLFPVGRGAAAILGNQHITQLYAQPVHVQIGDAGEDATEVGVGGEERDLHQRRAADGGRRPACIDITPPASQIIHVVADPPAKRVQAMGMQAMDPVWEEGTLEIAMSDTDMGCSSYRMKARGVSRYKK